jgi:hypothetical protein
MTYEERLKKIEAVMRPYGPGFGIVQALHDGWCPAAKTQDLHDCICDPDVEVIKFSGKGGN